MRRLHHNLGAMLVLFVLVFGYIPLPILNVTCPPMNIVLSLNCSTLEIQSKRDCECACLYLAKCDAPRCAYAVFDRMCAYDGNCVETCFCRDFLCSYEYTPQSTLDLRAQLEKETAERANEKKHNNNVVFVVAMITVFLIAGLVVGTVACVKESQKIHPAHRPMSAEDEGVDIDEG